MSPMLLDGAVFSHLRAVSFESRKSNELLKLTITEISLTKPRKGQQKLARVTALMDPKSPGVTALKSPNQMKLTSETT